MTQITGAPIWVRTDKYDLAAVADSEGQHTETFWRSTLQMYIAESFQLTFHRETGELPFYVLTVSNTGPRLNGSDGDPNGLPELSVTLGSKNPATANLAVISAKNASLEDLAGVLQRVVLEWPVIDHTGIAGRYDFILRWTPDGQNLAYAQYPQDKKFGEALWLQPVSGGPPQQVLNVTPDLLYWAAWSRDGKALAISHGRFVRDIVLVTRNGGSVASTSQVR